MSELYFKRKQVPTDNCKRCWIDQFASTTSCWSNPSRRGWSNILLSPTLLNIYSSLVVFLQLFQNMANVDLPTIDNRWWNNFMKNNWEKVACVVVAVADQRYLISGQLDLAEYCVSCSLVVKIFLSVWTWDRI